MKRTFTSYYLDPFNRIVFIISTSLQLNEIGNTSVTDVYWYFLRPFVIKAGPEKGLSKNSASLGSKYKYNSNSNITSNPFLCQSSVTIHFIFANTTLAQHANSIHIWPSELYVYVSILYPFYFPATRSVVNVIFGHSLSPALARC